MNITKNDADKIKQNVVTAWDNLQEIAKAEHQEELIEGFDAAVQQMKRGAFRLVVMGEIKKGKSSFINALLGENDLLPTASDVATSTVYQIIYGPEKKIKVFFKPDIDTNNRPDALEITENQLPDYGTENGNPDNLKNVDYIAVELPNELLKSGLIIVDTPGVGGLFRKHKEITWRYAPNADAIFFVLDSVEAVISRDEIDFLKDLTDKMTKRIYFIQTKKDVPGEEQWQAWEKRNIEIITEKLPFTSDNIKYFPVSSTLKFKGDLKSKERFIQDSGFPVVLDFLQNVLIANKDVVLCNEIISVMINNFKTIRNVIIQRVRISQTDNKGEIVGIEQKLKIAQQNLVQWEKETYREEKQKFSYSFQDIKSNFIHKLQSKFNITNPEIVALIDNNREDSKIKAKELNEKIGEIQKELVDRCEETVINVQENFNENINSLVIETTHLLTTSMNENEKVLQSLPNANIAKEFDINIQNSLNMRFNKMETLKGVVMGGRSTMGIAGLVVGIACIAFPPTAIASAIAISGVVGGAGLLGAWSGFKSVSERQKEQAINKLEKLFAQTLSQVQRQSVHEFQKMAKESERNAIKLFDNALKSAKDQFEKQRKDVQIVHKETKESLQTKISEAKNLIMKIDTSLKLIKKA